MLVCVFVCVYVLQNGRHNLGWIWTGRISQTNTHSIGREGRGERERTQEVGCPGRRVHTEIKTSANKGIQEEGERGGRKEVEEEEKGHVNHHWVCGSWAPLSRDQISTGLNSEVNRRVRETLRLQERVSLHLVSLDLQMPARYLFFIAGVERTHRPTHSLHV